MPVLLMLLCWACWLNTRSGAESTKAEIDNDDNDSVELEKSNVLLLGPTGSGRISVFLILYFDGAYSAMLLSSLQIGWYFRHFCSC